MITIRDLRVTGQIGKPVTLDCHIEAYPRGIHFWELGTGEIIR